MLKAAFLSALFLTCSGAVFSQFIRSFDHANTVSTASYSVATTESDANLALFSVTLANTDTLLVVGRVMDQKGTLLEYHTLTIPTSNQLLDYVSLKLVTKVNNEYVLVYTTFSSSDQKIGTIKLNASNANLIEHNQINSTFLPANQPFNLSGNEIITYQFTTAGLTRLSLPLSNLSTFSSEIVDNTLVPGSSNFSWYLSNKRNGQFFTFNGHETFYVNYQGLSTFRCYERLAANSYTLHNTSITINNTPSDIISLSNGNYALNISNRIYLLDGSLNQITSRSIGSNAFADLEEWNGKIHSLAIGLPTPNNSYERTYDLALNPLDSCKLRISSITGYAKLLNQLSFFGSGGFKTNQCDYNGNDIMFSAKAYLSFNRPLLPIQIEEYVLPFETENVSILSGLGNETVSSFSSTFDKNAFQDTLACINQVKDFNIGYSNGQFFGAQRNAFNKYFQTDLPGPYTPAANYSAIIEAKYNRPYYVTKQMIMDHIDSLQSGSTTYEITRSIKEWPGNGNTAIGQAAILAPFVDINSNNIYEPELGDYPIIYGDECVFSITHEAENAPLSSQMEFHSYVYRIKCDTSTTYKDVIFKKMRVFARGKDIDSLKTFTFNDTDLGNYLDDFVGTNVELGLMYTYNGDLIDEAIGGKSGFGNKQYSVGLLSLKGPKLVNNATDDTDGQPISSGIPVNAFGLNDGIVDNETFTLEGSTIQTGTSASLENFSSTMELDFHSQTMWSEGSPRYFSTTTILSDYAYPATSDPLLYGTNGVDPNFQSSEFEPDGQGSNSNPPGDRRFIAYNGKNASTLSINDYLEKEYALVVAFSTDTVQTLWDSPNLLFAKAQSIKDAYNVNNGPCGAVFNPIEEDLKLTEPGLIQAVLYPNPTTGLFTIQGLPTNAQITVVDANGRIVANTKTSTDKWTANSNDWDGSLFFVKIQTPQQATTLKLVKL